MFHQKVDWKKNKSGWRPSTPHLMLPDTRTVVYGCSGNAEPGVGIDCYRWAGRTAPRVYIHYSFRSNSGNRGKYPLAINDKRQALIHIYGKLIVSHTPSNILLVFVCLFLFSVVIWIKNSSKCKQKHLFMICSCCGDQRSIHMRLCVSMCGECTRSWHVLSIGQCVCLTHIKFNLLTNDMGFHIYIIFPLPFLLIWNIIAFFRIFVWLFGREKKIENLNSFLSRTRTFI